MIKEFATLLLLLYNKSYDCRMFYANDLQHRGHFVFFPKILIELKYLNDFHLPGSGMSFSAKTPTSDSWDFDGPDRTKIASNGSRINGESPKLVSVGGSNLKVGSSGLGSENSTTFIPLSHLDRRTLADFPEKNKKTKKHNETILQI
jgi:hypothetical protein